MKHYQNLTVPNYVILGFVGFGHVSLGLNLATFPYITCRLAWTGWDETKAEFRI